MNTENPYASPATIETDTSRPVGIQVVARLHWAMLLCVFVGFSGLIGTHIFSLEVGEGIFAQPKHSSMAIILYTVSILAFGGAWLAGSVVALMLALRIYGGVLGVIVGLFCLVPFLGLLGFLLILAKASRYLYDRGYRLNVYGMAVWRGDP